MKVKLSVSIRTYSNIKDRWHQVQVGNNLVDGGLVQDVHHIHHLRVIIVKLSRSDAVSMLKLIAGPRPIDWPALAVAKTCHFCQTLQGIIK